MTPERAYFATAVIWTAIAGNQARYAVTASSLVDQDILLLGCVLAIVAAVLHVAKAGR